jgi:hypothetical protein
MSLTSPFTGATMTGYLTSPTYTVTLDMPPSNNGKQYAVTTLGGTQTGVVVSSVDTPFTLTVFKPGTLKQVPLVSPATGVFVSPVGRNVWRRLVRKGLIPLAGQAPQIGLVDVKIDLPAGCTAADTNSVAALLSAAIGALNDQATAIMNEVKTGVITF